MLAALVLAIAAALPAEAQTAWVTSIAAGDFNRGYTTQPDGLQRMKAGGSWSGPPNDWGLTGWLEYDFRVPKTGWYEISTEGAAGGVDFVIDPDRRDPSRGLLTEYGGSGRWGPDGVKVTNVWLDAGAHVIRAERWFWTGFPRVTAIRIRESAPSVLKTVLLRPTSRQNSFRKGECAPVELWTGGATIPSDLRLAVMTEVDKKIVRRIPLQVQPGNELRKQTVRLPCDEEGVWFVALDGIDWGEVKPITYEVVDVKSPATTRPSTTTLVTEIDCATKEPDYLGGGGTRLRTLGDVSYRESGDAGFTSWQRVPGPARAALPEPSWFAYRLPAIKPQQQYIVDVDYPDDDLRSFTIALRESNPLYYPIAGGIDSGGEFSLSRRIQTHRLIAWSRSENPRLVFANAHGGRRAACAKIRVSRVDGDLPELPVRGKSNREFLNWYEEGGHVLNNYAPENDWDPAHLAVATKRWMQTMRHVGVTTVSPTVVIYSFALYPSTYNRSFSDPAYDGLRRMILWAEKFGVKVVPELHPRADELDWPFAAVPDPKPNLLATKDGQTHFYQGDGKTRRVPPNFNPIHPDNQNWYVGMIGELADRYKDSPAFGGVSLRLMDWVNASLNNFHSLDWGYDDFTVEQFVRDTGAKVPGPIPSPGGRLTPAIAKARYDWIMANARQQWIDWRCQRIAALYKRIVDRVRQARPDLTVQTTVFGRGSDPYVETWRGAGIDVALLSRIEGLTLVNAVQIYGRKEADLRSSQTRRDELLDPKVLSSLRANGRPGSFLSSGWYIEATEAVIPPVALGFAANTKQTWTSGAGHPAGRHAIERYAVALAETDATTLGDGGNGYTLNQPVLGEFLREYLVLPREPFASREEALDPVAVRTLSKGDALWFYMVNRERYPIKVRAAIEGTDAVSRAGTGERVALQGGALEVELAPYQLLSFTAPSSAALRKITTTVPQAESAKLSRQIEWLAGAAKRSPIRSMTLSDDQRRTLSQALAEARAEFEKGHVWRARTLIERYPLQEIYGKLGESPPGLRDPEGK